MTPEPSSNSPSEMVAEKEDGVDMFDVRNILTNWRKIHWRVYESRK